jgi:dTMP kinase
MEKNPYSGKFIVFEGLDGSGSSTQASKLTDWINEKQKESFPGKPAAFLTKEPTNNLIGGLIRGQLTGSWKSSIECLQLLFSADRSFHLEKEVIPSLQKGITVISDRYFLSTVAFGALEIKDIEWLLEINKLFILPDLTFLIKVSPKVCLERIAKSRFQFELFEKERSLEKVWENYEILAERFKNLYIIDGEKTENEVFEEVKKIVRSKLNL